MEPIKKWLAIGSLAIAMIVGLQVSCLLRQVANSIDLITEAAIGDMAQANAVLMKVQETNEAVKTAVDALPDHLDRVVAAVEGINSTFDEETYRLNSTIEVFGTGAVAQLQAFNDSLKPVSESVVRAADQAAEIQTIFTKQFLICERNPGCLKSRSDAITGELMRTMDSGRRTLAQVEKATPLFLERFAAFSESTNGIAADVHVVTSRYANPSLKSKIYSGVVDGIKVCALLC